MELLELSEREARERKATGGTPPARRGGSPGFLGRKFVDEEDEAEQRDRRNGRRAYDRDACERRRNRDAFDFD